MKPPGKATGSRRTPSDDHHSGVVTRLRRACGQLEGVLAMYDDGRYPPDVLAQLSAVRRAIDGVALIILEDHIESCVHKAVAGRGNQPTAQLMQGIRRYLKTR